MRHRVKEYDIIAPYAIDIAGNVTIEDIRLIVNETQGVVICSSMQKGNIVAISTGSESTTLSINPSVCTLNTDDILTIEIDKGDSLSSVESKVDEGVSTLSAKIDNIKLPEIDTILLAKEETLITESQAIQSAVNNIDLSPIEAKVEVGVETLSSKIDNIKLPEIDTTELAKQGENQEATNSAILDGINEIFNKFDSQYAAQLHDIIGD